MSSKVPAMHSRSVSYSLLVVLSVSIFLNMGALFSSFRILARGTQEYFGDQPRELPLKVRSIQAAFHDDPSHYRMDNPGFAEWNAIRPPGKGYVFLGQEHFVFGVSMWHQIHCLSYLRAVLLNGGDGSDHTEHCFHYLRQAILCAADTTLEPGGVSKRLANGDVVANGYGTVHTCRDWKQIYDWMGDQHEKWTPEMHERFEEVNEMGGMGNMTTRHGGHNHHALR